MSENKDNGKNTENFHEYDGIIEHDNPLPTWWLWSFFLTIIFAFIYFLHYEIANGPTLTDELKVSMQEIEKQQAVNVTSSPTETEDSLKEAFNKDGMLNAGKALFESKCVACHGPLLQGSIGPNLTDKFWINGAGTRMDIVKVIRTGVADKGMPPWGSVLKTEELYAVAAYVVTKQGSNPPGAKAPQGQEAP